MARVMKCSAKAAMKAAKAALQKCPKCPHKAAMKCSRSAPAKAAKAAMKCKAVKAMKVRRPQRCSKVKKAMKVAECSKVMKARKAAEATKKCGVFLRSSQPQEWCLKNMAALAKKDLLCYTDQKLKDFGECVWRLLMNEIRTLGEQLASAAKEQVETRGATITDSKEQVETRGATITDPKVQVHSSEKEQVAQKVWNFDNGERWVLGYCWKNGRPTSKYIIIDKEVECEKDMPIVSGGCSWCRWTSCQRCRGRGGGSAALPARLGAA